MPLSRTGLSQHKLKGTNPLRLWSLMVASVLTGALTASCGGGETTSAAHVSLDKANMLPAAQKANDSFVLFDLAIFAGDYMLWGNDWFESGKAYACVKDDANSGTVTFTASRTGGAFQVDDVLTVNYDNCQQDESDPARTTGRLALRVLAISGNPASEVLGQPWSYKANVQYKQLTVLSPRARSVIDGEMQVTESSPGIINTDFDERITTRLETSSMRLTEDADTHTYSKVSGTLISDYTGDHTWTATISTELSSTALAGTLSFATLEPFKGVLGNPFPSAGLARIDAGAQQQLQLRAKPLGVEGTLSTQQATEAFFIEWANF